MKQAFRNEPVAKFHRLFLAIRLILIHTMIQFILQSEILFML